MEGCNGPFYERLFWQIFAWREVVVPGYQALAQRSDVSNNPADGGGIA